jgi:predicted dehydrogenase
MYTVRRSAFLATFSKTVSISFVLIALFHSAFGQKDSVRLITLDPGHFHAALVQKKMLEHVSPTVYVYAPGGPELDAHLALIDKFNTRPGEPTSWKEQVYKGPDYFEKMLAEKPGNVVIIAGNNLKKTEYIKRSVEAGLNVLADKPMAINTTGFQQLLDAFATAEKNKVLLYDIMTERYEITNALQRDFAQFEDVFGKLVKGTADEPAVVTESVHHFYKEVSGAALVRPPWFFDVDQAGNGIVDVTTHLVDLIQWECFPRVALDYKRDIKMLSAKQWATDLTDEQFKKVTNQEVFPDFLKKDLKNGVLKVYANGEMNYTIKGTHAKVTVMWNFESPEGGGDTHFSIMRGTKANLIIKQGKEQQYKPVLYIEPGNKTNDAAWVEALNKSLKKIDEKF